MRDLWKSAKRVLGVDGYLFFAVIVGFLIGAAFAVCIAGH